VNGSRLVAKAWVRPRAIALEVCGAALATVALLASAQPGPPPMDAATTGRIDTFVAQQVADSGIPGVAIAVLQEGRAPHVRGFGHDGRGRSISADTPFPIGSLTKSFTALLVRQAIDAGQLDADAPVQRYLPWFRVADAEASARITLRHLLNQTSGFSRADGIAPLLQGSGASIEELARGLSAVSLNRPVGERFEYSNLNYVLLGAVLQAVTGRSWQDLVQTRVLRPLQMSHSHTDHDVARQAGMTALHRMWFGVPVAQQTSLLPGFAPTGSLVASAGDMARYLQMLLDGGMGPGGRVLSADGVAQLLAPASPPGRSKLLSADFQFRYGEGWFVGPFGGAADARWHLGNLASFAAWMVLLPDTKQAVVVLINANSELPFNEVNAVMSRLPIGVVNLLRGQPVPQGPSLREAYLPLNAATAFVVIALSVLAWWAARTRRAVGSGVLLLTAIVLLATLQMTGLNAKVLSAFAPDFALVLAVAIALLCVPAAWRAWAWARRSLGRNGGARQP
jgi:CubicO group peptidase (beta-lactamase class C family)